MFHLGGRPLHPHPFFEALGYLGALCAYFLLRRRFGDPIHGPLRWALLAVAVSGALVGAKVLYWLEDPWLTWQNRSQLAYWLGGKTIVGALGLGLVAVELTKRYLGLRRSTGDLYAIPLALGIAIGRLGCFLSGLDDNTYGTPTTLAWGVDFGDGVPRHPTQLYEVVFLLALIPLLYHILERVSEQERREVPRAANACVFVAGDAFKIFMASYAGFRLFADFLKPYARLFLDLGAIQWASVLILFYYSADIWRWWRGAGVRRLARESHQDGSPSRL